MSKQIDFGNILDAAEQLDVDAQAELVAVLSRRLAERGRERVTAAVAQARRELATASATRTRRLEAGGAATKAQLDSDEAQLKTVSSDAQALQAQIEKKTIRAPFGGKLGIRSTSAGRSARRVSGTRAPPVR